MWLVHWEVWGTALRSGECQDEEEEVRVAKEEETSENGGKEGRMMGQTRKGSIGGEGWGD